MAGLPAPDGLDSAGTDLWSKIAGTGKYEFRADELRVLDDACRTADIIAKLEAELAKGELTVRGSQGQPVANPMLGELRQYRALLRGQLKSLNLPDEDGRASEDRSTKARNAANARWKRTG